MADKELIRRALLGSREAQKLKLKKVWRGMKERCERPNHSSYKNYGARGISVCDSWKDDFDCFYQWAIANGYSNGLSLDRIDNDGNYCPENCRWATCKQQGNNTRSCRFITYNGDTKTMREWEEHLGLGRGVNGFGGG